MYTNLIDYFNRGIKTTNKADAMPFKKVNELAVRLGYVIHPDCCNKYVWEWLNCQTMNHNATFYKEWNDVISKNRFELLIDQLMHYATTYGTEFSVGNGYVPNDGAVVPAFKELKVIEPITDEEIFEKCMKMLSSGVALKDSTVEVFIEFILKYIRDTIKTDDEIISILTRITNKEAQAGLAYTLNLLPSDEFGILRCLVYRYTKSALLIKSPEVLSAIKRCSADEVMLGSKVPLETLSDKQLEKLSRIFYRFKPIFLAMKTKRTASIINKIRRLAKKNHTPLNIGFWENIISEPRDITEVCFRLKDLDNFKKVRLLMMLKEKLDYPTTAGVFPVRNGKLYVRDNYAPMYDLNWLESLYNAVKASLVNSLSKKACLIKLPDNYRIALPSSEKNFVGNLPFGTSFKMTRNNIVGVYWRNEWGTHDYDLGFTDVRGRMLSWRSDYINGNKTIIYSGDMTNAEPEASELFFIENNAPDGIIKLNKFNGMDDSKFRFFFANEKRDAKHQRDRMVDPNNIKLDVMIPFVGQGEKTIGMMFDDNFYFMDFGTGRNRAASGGKYVDTIISSMKQKAKCFIYLDEILFEAGFSRIPDDEELPEGGIDFRNLEKDTLINLLSTEE